MKKNSKKKVVIKTEKIGLHTVQLVNVKNNSVIAKLTKLRKNLIWKMIAENIWHLVDIDDNNKVVAKVLRPEFKDRKEWLRWSVHNYSCSNHKNLRSAVKEAEKDFLWNV